VSVRERSPPPPGRGYLQRRKLRPVPGIPDRGESTLQHQLRQGRSGAAAGKRAVERAIAVLIGPMANTILTRALPAAAFVVLTTVLAVGGRRTTIRTAAAASVQSQSPDAFNEALVRAFTFRNVGPFRMQARAS